MPSPTLSFSLQNKLLAAIASGLLLVMLFALFGLASAWRSLSVEVPLPVQQAAEAEQISRHFRLQVQEWKNILIRGADPQRHEQYLQAFDSQGKQVQDIAHGLARTLQEPQARQLAQRFADEHTTLQQQYHQALAGFAEAGFDTQAGDALVTGLDRAPSQTLEALLGRTQALADSAVVQRSENARSTLLGSALLTVAAGVLLLLLMGWWLRRSLIAPVLAITAQANRIAAGDLGPAPAIANRDELGSLAQAMQQMAATLQAVIAAQQQMADAHASGQVSHRIESARFPGKYGLMADGSNQLVDGHTRLADELMAIMQRYAIGDLSQDLRQLPGEQARISAAMATTKHNLGAINTQIQQLAGAAAAGDFSLRGDVDAFSHAFADMVSSLNTLMTTTDDNLMQVSAVLRAIAAGELDHHMHGHAQGVFALMRRDAASSIDNLRQMIGRIVQASSTIGSAANEMAQGNADLSQRTEQQAANLEETAASMEELTSTVRQNAQAAHTADQLMRDAAGLASTAGELAAGTMQTMTQIEQSSQRIAQIIEVIDGLAFQTNLLSLNAAVEAARAGEQGRGFAVVASEVRNLAQRSADASQQIRGLIDASVQTVNAGSAQVQQAGQTMGQMVQAIHQATALMGEISAASQEQSAGIEQVNQTIIALDNGTQQNAALVEEATAAAAAVNEQARQLATAVSAFRL